MTDKHVILVPLSIIVPCDPAKTRQAFAELGVTSWQFFSNWFKWNPVVANYRLGKFDHEAFRNKLKQIFPVLNSHSDEKFDNAWNLMCEYTDNSTEAFKALQSLSEQGQKKVIIFSRTNPKHIEFITAKYREATQNPDANLPGKVLWSYQYPILLEDLKYIVQSERLKDDKTLLSFQVYYTQPTDPAPGLMGWFQKPYEKWMFKGAEKYVKRMHKDAKEENFKMVRCDGNNSLASKLTSHSEDTDNEAFPPASLRIPPVVTFRPGLLGTETKQQSKKSAEANALPKAKARRCCPRLVKQS